ncbi:MAG: outer membrane beta-barrel protein [Balneola sp.]
MKYIYALLILVFLLPYRSYSQHSSNFEFGISANFNFIARDQFSFFIIETTREIQYIQDASFRLMPSLTIGYYLTPRFSITSGLQLYDFGHDSDRLQINQSSPAERSSHRYRAYFLTIPLGVDYKFINEKFKASVHTSFLADIYLGERSNEPEFNMLNTFDWNTINFSALAGLGFEYAISNRSTLSVQPYFSVPLHDYVDKSGPSRTQNIKPFRLGLTFGAKYRLK